MSESSFGARSSALARGASSVRSPMPASVAPSALDTPDEQLALSYIVHDDKQAFRALYERLYPRLLRIAQRRVRCSALAADLVQQAFLNAHAARERFEPGSAYGPWITRILMNLLLDQYRAGRRRVVVDLDPQELPAVEHATSAERLQDIQRARRALERLRPRQRQVLEMHWLEERSFPEVAARLGERVVTVKVRAHRACSELRRELDRVA
ncbi:MAG TPA: RNA polymerase sigma factor [Polyangiaceae bacterium]|nr:RNA polymerase sigma factor [Polyangiaceae bacterium]